MERAPSLLLTADDLWSTPNDGNRYEIIDGVLYVNPPPSYLHQRVSFKLGLYLGNHVYANQLGEIVAAPIGLVLDESSPVEPDLVFVRRERLDIITDRAIEGVPDLVVEVLSPSNADYDRRVKYQKYERAGVPHYWMVHPLQRRIETYRLGPRGYELVGTFGSGDTFTTDLFPGLRVPIDDLWA